MSSSLLTVLKNFFFWFLPVLFFQPVLGQVAGTVTFGDNRSGPVKEIAIGWLQTAEDSWKSKTYDKLDVMAVKTGIHSSTLPLSSTNSTQYAFRLSKMTAMEVLIDFESIATGEVMELKEAVTGEVLFSTTDLASKKSLLPVVDPHAAVFIWTVSEGQPYKSQFTIQTVYVHDHPAGTRSMIGFGTAMPCHPNAACKKDSMLSVIANSAVRIRLIMEEGIGWCSGSFINNTRHDKTPYVLLAYHCTFEFTPHYDMWRFDLEYKADSCINPSAEPVAFSMTGCDRRAGGQASDFLLVELKEKIPSNHNITFAGWDRDDIETPDTTFLVHHPNADIRKFSTCTNKAVIHPNQIGWSQGYTTPPNHHFRFKFTEGGHQAGSSGGPVFNENALIVGQLHGGSSGCEQNNNAFAGRFSKSWDAGASAAERLKEWLDPDSHEFTWIQSIENISPGDFTNIKGIVKDPAGRPVPNTMIRITGSVEELLTTDAAGEFVLSGVNRNDIYSIKPSRNINPVNGVSAIDLLAIQKHILFKDLFTEPWKILAADASNNGSVTAGDIVLLLKLILGKINSIPTSPSWKFIPEEITLQNIPQGPHPIVEFQAVKIGDVNGSADPSQ